MRYSQWKISGYDRPAAVALCRSGINPLVSVVLASRGITHLEAAQALLADGGSQFYDPFLLQDMDKATTRIQQAIDQGEHVAVYGDYDVDGMTASTVMAGYLRAQGLQCEIYIPGRICEGYGVSRHGLDQLHRQGVTLLITVDCGITACGETEYARQLGIDMVITDHHECQNTLPDAVAVVDPRRPDSAYPNRSLAGVGVAFKLICALAGTEKLDEMVDRYSDLVAVGTIADVMPVTGENRLLIRRGLQRLKTAPRPGLRRLMAEAGVDGTKLNSTAVGFSLAPRLNAAGRMENAMLSVRLLLSQEAHEADSLTVELCALNDRRRALEHTIYTQALAMLGDMPPEGPIVLASSDWHQGVVGIVASRIVEQFNLPTVMICLDDGVGKGSCRCPAAFNMFEALGYCSNLLTSFGGHKLAAGLTIEEKNIPAFRQAMQDCYAAQVQTPPENILNVDFEVIKPGLLTFGNVESLNVLEPYGNGNTPPVLCIKQAFLDNVIPMGGGKHTKLRISKFGEHYDCVCFSRTAADLGVQAGDVVDLAFGPRVNEFRGRRSVQLLLEDICRV